MDNNPQIEMHPALAGIPAVQQQIRDDLAKYVDWRDSNDKPGEEEVPYLKWQNVRNLLTDATGGLWETAVEIISINRQDAVRLTITLSSPDGQSLTKQAFGQIDPARLDNSGIPIVNRFPRIETAQSLALTRAAALFGIDVPIDLSRRPKQRDSAAAPARNDQPRPPAETRPAPEPTPSPTAGNPPRRAAAPSAPRGPENTPPPGEPRTASGVARRAPPPPPGNHHAADRDALTCPRCGNSKRAGFELCYNCERGITPQPAARPAGPATRPPPDLADVDDLPF